MVVTSMIQAMTDAIKQNMESYCKNHDFSKLTPELAEAMTEGISRTVSQAGVAGYRSLLESYEEHAPVIERDGEQYRLKGPVPKEYLTSFGPMQVSRNLYQNKSDTKSHVPLEAAWGMTDEFMTREVREAVLHSCAFVTPDEARLMFQKCAMFQPSATAMKQVIAENGQRMEGRKLELDDQIRAQETVPKGTRVLAASMDGVNVLLNERGVKRGRPSERPTGKDSQTTPTAYKNAMVGSVSFYGPVPEGEKSPERLACRYTAHMPEEGAPTFKKQFEDEVRSAHEKCNKDVVKVLVLDGAPHLWKYVEAKPLFQEYEKIIDYWHTLEHLSAAGEALFGKDDPEAESWYEKYRTILLESDTGAQSVVRSMAYYASTRIRPAARREELRKQTTFFQRNKHRMQYAGFRRRGLPIGSGPVEAACKTLVKTRMCRSGMRWSRQGGENILDIRTYVKSDRWDSAWSEIKRLSLAA
jgi:hypothetical protein